MYCAFAGTLPDATSGPLVQYLCRAVDCSKSPLFQEILSIIFVCCYLQSAISTHIHVANTQTATVCTYAAAMCAYVTAIGAYANCCRYHYIKCFMLMQANIGLQKFRSEFLKARAARLQQSEERTPCYFL